jgi:hypothetical protein
MNSEKRRLAESPYATLFTGNFSGFVASAAAPIATGRSDPVPGRVFPPAVDQRLSRLTAMRMPRQLTCETAVCAETPPRSQTVTITCDNSHRPVDNCKQ